MCSRLIPPDLWLHVRFTITLSLFASSATSGYEALIFLSLKVINCICWAVLLPIRLKQSSSSPVVKVHVYPRGFHLSLTLSKQSEGRGIVHLENLIGWHDSVWYVFFSLDRTHLNNISCSPGIDLEINFRHTHDLHCRTDLERKRSLYSMYRFSFRS